VEWRLKWEPIGTTIWLNFTEELASSHSINEGQAISAVFLLSDSKSIRLVTASTNWSVLQQICLYLLREPTLSRAWQHLHGWPSTYQKRCPHVLAGSAYPWLMPARWGVLFSEAHWSHIVVLTGFHLKSSLCRLICRFVMYSANYCLFRWSVGFKAKSKLSYERRSIGRSVLVSGTHDQFFFPFPWNYL
jgi:hypothetical protein